MRRIPTLSVEVCCLIMFSLFRMYGQAVQEDALKELQEASLSMTSEVHRVVYVQEEVD